MQKNGECAAGSERAQEIGSGGRRKNKFDLLLTCTSLLCFCFSMTSGAGCKITDIYIIIIIIPILKLLEDQKKRKHQLLRKTNVR